jgi:hypothetical protein
MENNHVVGVGRPETVLFLGAVWFLEALVAG